MQVTELVRDPKIQKLIGVHARRLSNRYPRTLEYADAQQCLFLHLVEKVEKKYDPSRSSIHTFSNTVVKNYCNTLLYSPYSTFVRHEGGVELSADLSDSRYYLWEQQVVLKVSLDLVETDLREAPELALKVFRMLRQGMRVVDCANALGVSESCITKVVTRHIKNVVSNRCA